VIHLITGSDESVRAGLRVVSDALTSLDQKVRDALAVVDQLSTQLEGRRDWSPDSRVTVWSRQSTSFPTVTNGGVDGEVRLRLFCLGPFEVYLGEECIPLRRMSKGRTILQFLASRPRQPVLRDVLLEALWPEDDPDVANNRLKVAMHHLRQNRAAGDAEGEHGEYVIFRDGCYMFSPHLPVWTDVEAFEAAWKTGARLERSGRPEQAIPFFEQAEALYRGDYFEDDRFEEWMLVRREELKETYLRILDKLSHFWLRQGVLESAIDGWKKILVKDPWREDVYRHLMVCFARNGQRGLALHWYDVCVQVLEKELQLAPEPETITLYNRIRRGEPVGDDRIP
jgi:DNA-binding SARP family transcriptional activator